MLVKPKKGLSLLFAVVIFFSAFLTSEVLFPSKANAATIVSQVVTNSDGKGYLQVDGKPFLIGHVQNCGQQQLQTDEPNYPFETPMPQSWLENAFEKTAQLGYKTISIILKWKEIEPTTQGSYNWDIIDDYVDWCNEYNLYLDIAWFGSNSGGGTRIPDTVLSHPQGYAHNIPAYLHDEQYWFNHDQWQYFWSPYIVNGGEHDTQAQFVDTCEYNAVNSMFNHLATYDTNHRTIMFQVFNEPDYHPTWSSDLTNHLTRINNLAKAVKDANYVVATRVNLATTNQSNDQAISNLQYVDFVGHDPYTTSVTTLKNYMTPNNSPIKYIAENAASNANTTSLALTCIVNGGFYDAWPLNDHWGAWGLNDQNIDTFVNWTLGVLPPLSHAGEDMKNLNTAMNKIDRLIARSPSFSMAGFNIDMDNPATSFDSGIKSAGGLGVGFVTSDASVGLAVREGDNVYLMSDTGNPSPVNLAIGKTATMSTTSFSGHSANMAIDNDTSTYAQSDNNSAWSLTVDLGSSMSINRVVFTPDLTNYLKTYTIETSTDNTNWSQKANVTDSSAITRTFDFTTTSARYVRIHGYAVSGGGATWGHAIRGVKIFNTDNNSSSTVTFKTNQQPVSASVGYIDSNDNWVNQGTRSYTSNGDGTYSIAYNSQECIKVQFPYYKIKNRWTNEYLNIKDLNGKVQCTLLSDPNAWSAQWQLEFVDGTFYRLKNRWTGYYIHIQDNPGYAEYGVLGEPGWWSAQWKFVDIDGTYKKINNRWQTNQYMHIQNSLGYAESSALGEPNWWSAQWVMELVQ